MKVTRAPECLCGSRSGDGLDHQQWCPYATWYVRALWYAQRAGI